MLGLVKVLALEGAEAGISASALCPAYVRTALVEQQLEERPLDDLLAPQAVKRLLEPAEVAAAAAWLLGPEARAADRRAARARPRLDRALALSRIRAGGRFLDEWAFAVRPIR